MKRLEIRSKIENRIRHPIHELDQTRATHRTVYSPPLCNPRKRIRSRRRSDFNSQSEIPGAAIQIEITAHVLSISSVFGRVSLERPGRISDDLGGERRQFALRESDPIGRVGVDGQ
jgi:hypothetical protein